jgi:anti-sigma B factor antagonist
VQMDISSLGDHLVRITLTGRLDTTGVDRVETRFTAALVPGANNAIIDLSRVDFVASMGIRMLLSAARSLQKKHARLVLYGAQAPVNQVFDAVCLQQIIPICGTEAEAMAAVTSSSS